MNALGFVVLRATTFGALFRAGKGGSDGFLHPTQCADEEDNGAGLFTRDRCLMQTAALLLSSHVANCRTHSLTIRLFCNGSVPFFSLISKALRHNSRTVFHGRCAQDY